MKPSGVLNFENVPADAGDPDVKVYVNGELVETGGGGGGDSDFTLAELTLNFTYPENETPMYEVCSQAIIEFPSPNAFGSENYTEDDSYKCLYTYAENHKLKLLLYKGKVYVPVYGFWSKISDIPPVSYNCSDAVCDPAPAVIEYNGDNYWEITGDCTITGTMAGE